MWHLEGKRKLLRHQWQVCELEQMWVLQLPSLPPC